jgi:purine-nucleoside phosphorylase
MLGISCITNAAAGISDSPLTHEEVGETAERVRGQFADLLAAAISFC